MNFFGCWLRGAGKTPPSSAEAAPPAKADQAKYVWPDCPPPNEHTRYLGANINGTQYKPSEVSPGRWQWIVDAEAKQEETHRSSLYWALRSRVLTDEEMAEVERYGDCLNIQNGMSYSAEAKARELNNALLQQFRLREIARAAAKSTNGPDPEGKL
jgi:hypothetical protein